MNNETKKYTGIFVEEHTSIGTEYYEDDYGHECASHPEKNKSELKLIETNTLKELFDMEEGDGDESGSWGITLEIIFNTESKEVLFVTSRYNSLMEMEENRDRLLRIESEKLHEKMVKDSEERMEQHIHQYDVDNSNA